MHIKNIEFIKLSKEKFGEQFNYEKLIYKNSQEKVTLICNKCGKEINVRPYAHLKSKGCPFCLGLRGNNTEKFIKRAKEIHGDKYDYTLANYVNKRTKISIICPMHGVFEQTPHNHINQKQGCPICGKEKAKLRNNNSRNYRKTTEEFQDELNLKYDGKYKIIGDYVNNKTPIEIFCNQTNKKGEKHGVFVTRPDSLTNGHGCPKCAVSISKGEDELYSYLNSIYNGEIIKRDRNILQNKKELDIFIPDLKIAFEYDGLVWHSEKFSDKKRILEKTNECEEQNIQLIHIFEDEWIHKNDICKSRISGFLGKNTRIFARKCEVKEISYKIAENFLFENHIQGPVKSKYNFGLFYGGELVSIMTFGNLRKNLGQNKEEGVFEMLRFCNKKYYNVIGGASKLFKFFIKTYLPKKIISYADRRWSIGRLYEKMGLKKEKNTQQNYFYIKKNELKRINRFSMRKDILIKQYNCPKEMTEKDFCEQNGFLRIYDCGNIKYIWTKEND